jgi:hypothetical protein
MPTPSNFISFTEGGKMTRRYRQIHLLPGYIKGGLFPKAVIQTLLDQPGCVGMRFYYGINDDFRQALILVGVDAAGNDMVTEPSGGLPGNVCLDVSAPCPPLCSVNNILNS